MYLRLGYNASGTQLINSQRVEEKSNIAEVDRTTAVSYTHLTLPTSAIV